MWKNGFFQFVYFSVFYHYNLLIFISLFPCFEFQFFSSFFNFFLQVGKKSGKSREFWVCDSTIKRTYFEFFKPQKYTFCHFIDDNYKNSFRGRYRGRGRADGARWSDGRSQQLSVPSVDDVARHGEGEDGGHRGCGLQARGTLPLEAGIEAVGVSMVPGEVMANLSSWASTALTTWPGMAKMVVVVIEGMAPGWAVDASFRGCWVIKMGAKKT